MKTTFIQGDDYQEEGAVYKTFGITKITESTEHENIIEVYGDEDLRDLILISLARGD